MANNIPSADPRLVEPQPGEVQPQDAAKMAKLFAKKAQMKMNAGATKKDVDKKVK